MNLTGSAAGRADRSAQGQERRTGEVPSLPLAVGLMLSHDVETLDRLISLYNRYEDKRTAVASTALPPSVRVNAALISEQEELLGDVS